MSSSQTDRNQIPIATRAVMLASVPMRVLLYSAKLRINTLRLYKYTFCLTFLLSLASYPNKTVNSPENLFRGLFSCHQIIAPLQCCVRPRSEEIMEDTEDKT